MGKKATLFLLYGLSIILTIIIAVITIVALNIGKFSPHQTIIMPFIGLILPALIFTNICYAIYWLIRRRWLICLIPIATIIGCFSYYGTFYRFGNATKEIVLQDKQNEKNIRVLTYNTHFFCSKEAEKNNILMSDFLKVQNIDIACFQEYEMPDKFKDTISQFRMLPYNYTNYNVKEKMSIAIYSKYPILDSKYVEYPFSNYGYIESTIALCSTNIITNEVKLSVDKYLKTIDSTIIVTDSTIKVKTDSITKTITDSLINLSKKITVINTHFQSTGVSTTRREVEKIEDSGENIANINIAERMTTRMSVSYKMRAQQIDIVLDAIKNSKYPVILCGDFNDTPLSYVYSKAASELIDGFKESGDGYMYTYKYFKKMLRIDYIFYGKEFKSVKYFSPNKDFSDHNPVISELKLL
ncbi:MAG: endonuclease/exonuclease/phosphatase family protein [Bacteroidales bacterium]